ncbi:phage portal protein [Streptomyces syringium]|uniref:phage portal protein n=1 Tax=Streptomyces syringium TaxID=76729 RepID=UPI0033D0FE18
MRSPLGALFSNQAPVPFVSRGHARFPFMQRRDAEVQMRAMGSVGTLFAIVRRTTEATSQVEWKLFRQAKSGLREDRVEVTSHAALDLWNKPNQFMPRQEFVETFQQHMDLTGEAWWVIARDPRASIPLELWPVRPDRMEPRPDPDEFLTGYLYRGPAGEQVPLGRDEVVQLRTPNPLDPYRGMGPVQALLADIDATKFSAEWNRSFFYNSAEPGGLVEVDKRLSDQEFDEFNARWGEQHKGVANAHRVGLLEGGMKWVDRKYTMRDMQFAELRQVSREIIREAFGMPKGMLGTVDDVNRANAEAGEVMFSRYLVVPRLERIKAALNHELLPLFGATARGLEFDYCDPVPADRELEAKELTAKAAAARELIDAGAYGPEALAAVGLPEIAFGQPDANPDRELLIKLVTNAPTLAPVILPLLGFDLSAAQQASNPKEIADLVQSIYLGVDTVVTWEEARQVLARAGAEINPSMPRPSAPGSAAAPSASLSLFDLARARPNRTQPGLRDQDDGEDPDLEPVRQQFEDALAQLLEDWDSIAEEQYDQLAAQIETAVDDEDPAALAALTVDTERGAALLRDALGLMAAAAAEQMAAEAAEQGVKVTAPIADPGLQAALKPRLRAAFGGELVEIAAATVGLLGVALAGAAGREALRLFTPGAAGSQIAGAVGDFMRGLGISFRRDQLAGALHRAQNVGRLATLGVAPVARYYASEKLDSGTCTPCAGIDGVEFEDLAEAVEAYGAGPYRECEGGIRCRGTVVARWDSAQ